MRSETRGLKESENLLNGEERSIRNHPAATLTTEMTLDELDREYTTLRQQADAVRSYL
jgi:hypothetical protein